MSYEHLPVIQKYNAMSANFADNTIFMNDGFVYLDENNYPIVNNNIKFNQFNSDWKFQAQLYYECVQQGGMYEGVYADLSCGFGGGLNLVSENFQFDKCIGIDVNPKHVRHCKKWNNKDEFRLGSATSMPLDNASIDVLTTVEALTYYVPYEQFINEAHRVLKPNGVLIVCGPWVNVLHKENIIEHKFNVEKTIDITLNVSMACGMDKYRRLKNNIQVFDIMFTDEQKYIKDSVMYSIMVYKKIY